MLALPETWALRCGVLLLGRDARFAVVPGRDPSLVPLLQFVPQCEEGGVEFNIAVDRV